MVKKYFYLLKSFLKTKYGSQFSSRSQLVLWQNKQVIMHLKKILPLSPFYQRRLNGLPFSEWQSIPAIDKNEMMNHFDTLNTVKIKKEEAFLHALNAERSRDFSKKLQKMTVGLSSGTSGHRGLFVVSDKESYEWAGAFLAKILPGSIFKKHRLALFLRSNSNLYTSTKRNRIQFQYFDLLTSIDQHVRTLNDYQPTIILAPPSMLRFLADAITRGELNIHPEKIFSIAEVLDPLDRIFIEKTFKQKLHQVYQCTEGFLGATCEHGTLHLNEDIVFIEKEYLDDTKNKFIPIITDFRRTSQPIIRYRLNDILTEASSPCPCQSPHMAIEMIEGRSDDIFYLPSKLDSTPVPVFPDYIRRAILECSETIEHYMVVQKNESLLHVFLSLSDPNLHEKIHGDIKESLINLFNKLKLNLPEIQFFSYIPCQEEKKLRRIKRDFTP